MAYIRVSIFNDLSVLPASHRFITIKYLARYQDSIFAFCERNLSFNSPWRKVLLETCQFLNSQENYLHFVVLQSSLVSSQELGNYHYLVPDQSSSRSSNRFEIHFYIIFPFMPTFSVEKIHNLTSCLVVSICAVYLFIYI
jgi:hypothetical protein